VFDRLEISLLPSGLRFAAQLRLRVNGGDVVEQAAGHEARGPLATDALLVGGPNSLHATVQERRVELGEPECTGGCRGFLSVVIQRVRGIVQWSSWRVPTGGTQPPEFHSMPASATPNWFGPYRPPTKALVVTMVWDVKAADRSFAMLP
jgi:hypothetical protein